MYKILFIIISLTISFADMYISGDARLRPRLDVKENTSSYDKQSDLYYLYRARLNIKADIGEGYFFSSKLGTNEVSAISKMAYDGDHTSAPGILNSSRPQVDFLQLYFGYQKENSGFWGGAFPLKSNPALDIHFYPTKMVDIPFALFNNGAVNGFGGYRKLSNYKLNWFLSVDNQKTNSVTKDDVKTDLNESYTFGLDTKINLGSIGFKPQLIATFGDSIDTQPLTYGGSLDLMELGGFKSSFSYFTSTNSQNSEYDANHIRLSVVKKIKIGDLKLFYDIATYKADELIDLSTNEEIGKMNFNYLWISYTYKLYDSDLGSIKLMPTIRIQNGGILDSDYYSDYSRSKFELTTEIKFK